MILTGDQLQRYRDNCLPRLWDMFTSAFPSSKDGGHGNTPGDLETGHALKHIQPRGGNDPGPDSSRATSRDSGVDLWDVYCCINKMYTEPLETILRHINHNGLNDEQFFIAFNKEIRHAAGNWFWGSLRRLFSWKRCSRITFVEVSSPPFLLLS